ncbi:uncharacterized protein LOC112128044 [Cimex lectularius]|uniref:Uncharacterized protein n=1 Tax=Cimex lectularius TaxID=79782 RepID=A0A8I6ST30_CIMLE|nr:uncharacterized protein LOC112128044 [Cimex lectularius]
MAHRLVRLSGILVEMTPLRENVLSLAKELPKREPIIKTQFDRYDVGDFLRANCSTAPSKPSASLSFFLNDNPVGVPGTRVYDSGNGLQHSILNLDLTVEPAHMSPNGHLALRCTALIGTLFRQSSEISLGPRTAEPVPERVTSPSSCPRCWLVNVYLIGLLTLVLETR